MIKKVWKMVLLIKGKIRHVLALVSDNVKVNTFLVELNVFGTHVA